MNNYNSIISSNIKKYRKEKNLTQPQLAKLINKSESTIRKYELGKVEPSFDILEKIATVLDISIFDLTIDISKLNVEISLVDAIDTLLKVKGYNVSNFTTEEYNKLEKYILDQIDTAIKLIK